MLVWLYVAELSCLTTFAPYQDVTIIGEKDSCIVLVNHNPKSPPQITVYKNSVYTIITPPSQTEALHKRLFFARIGMDKHHFTCNSRAS